MTSIQEAQGQWQVIRSRGRIKGLIALVVVVVVLLAVAVTAGGSAGIAVGAIAVVALVIFAVALFVGQRRTGVSITPEWAPKESPSSGYDDDDDDDDDDAPNVGAGGESGGGSGAPVDTEPTEPVRAVDGQMLGSALEALGQTVSPKLAKSYALGTIALAEGAITWTPSTVSAGQGITPLSAAAASVAAVERAPLWGSWALLRIELRVGGAWVFRVPSSVDLAPALAELGITFRQVDPQP